MSYLQTDCGKNVYFEDYGVGSSAVLLIHGWGFSCRAWDNTLPALLAAGHRVVMLDHRGCGASDKDFADMGINAIAGDVVALVDKLGLASVVLNGWSLGGAVAVEAASRLGSRCGGVVLTGGATPIYVQKPDLALGGTEADMAGTVAALQADRIGFLAGLVHAVCAKEVAPAITDWMWRVFCEASPLAHQTLAQLAPLDQRAQLAALDVPILSFVGTQDAFVAPDICRWVGANNARARLVEYEGVGHAPFIEVAEDYNRDLLAFLAELA
jgi:pimeloyl-[acyl-carrier protein] methyl ester esterase